MILEGVSAHLESALEQVRLDGMRVAESFAQVIGQSLKFDELEGKRYMLDPEDKLGEREGVQEAPSGDRKEEKSASTVSHGYEGIDEVHSEEDGDLLQPCDLSDDDLDLAPVASPRYLGRILECKYDNCNLCLT